MRATKFVVTGGTGFIGRHLAKELLKSGALVVIPTRRRDPIDPIEGATYAFADLDDRASLANLEVVMRGAQTAFHLAANVAWHSEFSADGFRSFQRHVTNPLLLLESCGSTLERVVFGSSMMVYPLYSDTPFVEDKDESPENLYGGEKLVFEHALASWANLTGRTWIGLRIAQVYGPAMTVNRFLPDMLEFVRSDREIVVFGANPPALDWVFVDDVVRALLLAAECDLSGPVNIGSGECSSNLDLVRILIKLSGSSSTVRIDDTRQVQARKQIVDLCRSGEWLGYRPQFSLVDGLSQMLRGAESTIKGPS